MNSRKSNGSNKFLWAKIFTIEFVAAFSILLSLVVFIFLTKLVIIEKNISFDETVFNSIEPYITPGRTKFMSFITFLGKHTFLIPFNILLILFFILNKRKWFSIKIATLSISGLLMKIFLKVLFQRERPLTPVIEKVSGYSFPSGHALVGISFYGLLIYVVWKEIKSFWLRWLLTILLVILILLICFSRIYLRVHYTSDVIAGLAAGFIWLIVALRILNWIEKKFIARKGSQKDASSN